MSNKAFQRKVSTENCLSTITAFASSTFQPQWPLLNPSKDHTECQNCQNHWISHNFQQTAVSSDNNCKMCALQISHKQSTRSHQASSGLSSRTEIQTQMCKDHYHHFSRTTSETHARFLQFNPIIIQITEQSIGLPQIKSPRSKQCLNGKNPKICVTCLPSS